MRKPGYGARHLSLENLSINRKQNKLIEFRNNQIAFPAKMALDIRPKFTMRLWLGPRTRYTNY